MVLAISFTTRHHCPQFTCPLVFLSTVYPLYQSENPRRVHFGH